MKKTTLIILTIAFVLGAAISMARADSSFVPEGLIKPVPPEVVAEIFKDQTKPDIPIINYLDQNKESPSTPEEAVPSEQPAEVEEDAEVPVKQEEKIDSDGDGVHDGIDVCPDDYDPNQADADGDGVGDICDNCIVTHNPDQAQTISEYYGDACVPNKIDHSENEEEIGKSPPEMPPIMPTGFSNDSCSLIPQANAGIGSIFTGIMWLVSLAYVASRRKKQ